MSREATLELVREVLGEDYLGARVESYQLNEQLDTKHCKIRCTVSGLFGASEREIEGQGVGFVDSVFHTFKDGLENEYPSLKSIRFTGFEVHGLFDRPHAETGSDAMGEVVLVVENSRGRRFDFRHTSRSMTASAMIATLQATEYFVNTERAVIVLCRALADARQRNRSDLVERYSLQLAQLVENSSYSEVIERLQNKS